MQQYGKLKGAERDFFDLLYNAKRNGLYSADIAFKAEVDLLESLHQLQQRTTEMAFNMLLCEEDLEKLSRQVRPQLVQIEQLRRRIEANA